MKKERNCLSCEIKLDDGSWVCNKCKRKNNKQRIASKMRRPTNYRGLRGEC